MSSIINSIETQAPSNLVVIEKSNTLVVSAPGPVETQAPSNLVVIEKSNTLVVSALGPVGTPGPAGPQGPAGNNSPNRFADLEDVLLVNLANDNFIQWNAALQVFLNQNSVDGGSF